MPDHATTTAPRAILTRRAALTGLSASALTWGCPARAAVERLADLEERHGGRLGVFALDTGSGRSLAHRADERFLMCSTTKLVSVAALLARIDLGTERLDRRILYGTTDVAVGFAPETTAHLVDGGMSVEALCRAAIVVSDNGAADLIFAALGGPLAVTRFVRGLGDDVTRFDRTEPTLNRPDGDLDTTTPHAFADLARTLTLGPALTTASRDRLNAWMAESTTGSKRLRAGVPPGWTAGDKTGTAGAQTDDVALLRPPGRAPIVVAAFYDAPRLRGEEREAVLRDVGAIAATLAA